MIQSVFGTEANLTLVRVTGCGGPARFLEAEGFKSITVRMHAQQDRRDLSHQPGRGGAGVGDKKPGEKHPEREHVRQFLQLNRVTTATVDVSWNEVINAYGQSEIEDGISVYKSSNAVIHDNYLQGGSRDTTTGRTREPASSCPTTEGTTTAHIPTRSCLGRTRASASSPGTTTRSRATASSPAAGCVTASQPCRPPTSESSCGTSTGIRPGPTTAPREHHWVDACAPAST